MSNFTNATETIRDEEYHRLLTKALGSCAVYKPKFGRGGKTGATLEQFQVFYEQDPLYHWVGLDSPLMYAAHKAAGGMTSIYRQLGIGCQWIMQQIFVQNLGITSSEANWSYDVPTGETTSRRLSLDGRIDLSHIRDAEARARVASWLDRAKAKALLPAATSSAIRGAVFEMRQGYKSKDSKRQNADIANAANAYANLYVPIIMLFSTHIDDDIAFRYTLKQWVILKGSLSGDSTDSTYAFCKEVLGYDLAGFFERRSPQLREEMGRILEELLSA